LFIDSRYFQDIQKSSSSKIESPKVGNLPLEFLVLVKVSEWELWVWTYLKRLPHGLIQALLGGVIGEECSLECGLKELLLPLWFCGQGPSDSDMKL